MFFNYYENYVFLNDLNGMHVIFPEELNLVSVP